MSMRCCRVVLDILLEENADDDDDVMDDWRSARIVRRILNLMECGSVHTHMASSSLIDENPFWDRYLLLCWSAGICLRQSARSSGDSGS